MSALSQDLGGHVDLFDIRQQSTDRDYKALKAGQKCEIIVIIEKIISIIGLDRLR